jgi:hypothetical protein
MYLIFNRQGNMFQIIHSNTLNNLLIVYVVQLKTFLLRKAFEADIFLM